MTSLLVAVLLLASAVARADSNDPRALLDAWQTSQNDRSYDAYATLYAPSFRGVRRVGARTVELDRDAWLRDRARMFKRPIKVVVTDVEVRDLELRFTQTFTSGSFSDRGPKRMQLERGPTGLRVVREEMLGSIVAPRSGAGAPAITTFAFVQGGELVVEPNAADRTKAAVRTLRNVTTKDSVDTTLRGSVDRAPAALSSLVGRRYRVFGQEGEVCVAHVGPRFSVIASSGSIVPNEGETRLPSTIAELSALDLASHVQVRTVAELVAESGDCVFGVWARDTDAKAPVAFAAPDDGARDATLAAIRRTPAWLALQREYRSLHATLVKERANPDDPHHGKPMPSHWDAWGFVDHQTFRSDATTTVRMEVGAGGECGESQFTGGIESIYEVPNAGGAPVEVFAYDADRGYVTVRPVALVDLDGDGVAELVVAGGESSDGYLDGALLVKKGARYALRPVLTSPRSGCHC